MISIEDRLRRLEDYEALRNLKARYAAYCDDNYDADSIASLFTIDAIWDGGPMGRGEGRDGIRELFLKSPGRMPFAIHYVTNPVIEIDGDRATGRWYLWQPCVAAKDVVAPHEEAVWMGGVYSDQYVRENDTWLFAHVQIELKMLSPYQAGWAKQRFPEGFA